MTPSSCTAIRATLDAVLDAFACGDLRAAAARFAPDGTYAEARKPVVSGRDAIAAHFAAFVASGASYRFVVDASIVEGDRACVLYRYQPLGGDGAPGRERAGCATVHFDDRAQITAWREYDG